MALNSSPQPEAPELLAVSFSYPPLAYPRSSQVARLLKHLLHINTTLICADEEGARRDPTMEPDAEARLAACLRVPFSLRGWRRLADRVASRFELPVWNRLPDPYVSWRPQVLRALKIFTRERGGYRPDVLATFGQPMSDHLVGIRLKKLYGVPWAAHFSDPWVDNPFHKYDAVSRRINLSLERKVMETADRLIFTSDETVELMMKKYPAAWKQKARVLSHSFDPSLYPRRQEAGKDIVVRYTGEFYGRRTPKPLAAALAAILSSSPALLDGVRFELIGPVTQEALAGSGIESLPEGLVTIRPPVNYSESLRLAADADGLLIVDAPAQRSVFLPSKLVDYIGAARPILGLTPPGTAADLISRLGGWVADPTDVEAMTRATRGFLSFLSEEGGAHGVWGEPELRRSFEAQVVADSFEAMLREMLA